MKNKLFLISIIGLVAALLSSFAVLGCESDDENGEGDDDGVKADWECAKERDGWTKCDAGKIQFCHIVEGMDPHFHYGFDCEGAGYKCMQLTEKKAFCYDDSKTCSAEDTRCEDNVAYNCYEGKLGVERCGTAKECHIHDDEAECVGDHDHDDHDHDDHDHD